MIDRIERITPAHFRRDYLDKRRPVILRGLGDAWRSRSWTPEYLKKAFGSFRIRYETWEGDGAMNDPLDFARRQRFFETTLDQYVQMMEDAAARPLRPFYGAQLPFAAAAEELRDTTATLDAYMGFPALYAASVRKKLKYSPLLWLGPGGTLSTLHFDRLDNFFFQVYGRKKWILIPPEQSECVHWPCYDFGKKLLHWSPVDVEHPDFGRFPRFAAARPIEFVVEPGEVLFIPAGWWHFVRAIDTSISLNFFWARPFHTALALRSYLYHYAKYSILERLSKPADRREPAS